MVLSCYLCVSAGSVVISLIAFLVLVICILSFFFVGYATSYAMINFINLFKELVLCDIDFFFLCFFSVFSCIDFCSLFPFFCLLCVFALLFLGSRWGCKDPDTTEPTQIFPSFVMIRIT